MAAKGFINTVKLNEKKFFAFSYINMCNKLCLQRYAST